MTKKTLDQVDAALLRERPVLVRADLNVPLGEDRIEDDSRIRASLPTLIHLLESGARVVVFSHLGRPGGRADARFTLDPVADRLGELLASPVHRSGAVVGADLREAVERLESGTLLLVENTRFHPGETTGDPALAAEWAGLGGLFVNDAFGAAHRAHASTTGIALAVRECGGEAVAGRLMERELRLLSRLLDAPEHPFVAILGGAKISGKIDVIEALLPRVDRLIVGGAMANTFLGALGLEVGASLVEEDRVETAREVLRVGAERVMLPVDCVVATEIMEGAETRSVLRARVGARDRIGDIGPESRAVFGAELAKARTVMWNGPMGVFETPPFGAGTLAVAHAVAEATDRGAFTVVGGGDSASAVEAAGVADRMSHVSTGGGASLEFLAGRELPAVAALSDRG